MLECFNNHWEFDFFADKRLVFQKAKPSRRPLTSKKALSRIERRLKKLQERKPITPSVGITNKDVNRHTRTSELSKPLDKKSADIAERRDALDGKLEARETKRMQEAHESLYTEYMNPAFMIHLRMKGLADEVIPVLNLIMEHPGDFDYKIVGGNKHITKLKPYKGRPSAISDDFLVIIEKGGRILKVRNKDAKWKPEKNVDEDFGKGGKDPWMSNAEFNKKMGLYDEQWTSEHSRHLYNREYQEWEANGRQPPGKYEELLRKSFDNIHGSLQNIHVAMDIDFPQRFVDKINIRNLQFENDNEQVKEILRVHPTQGKTYEDITRRAYDSPDYEGQWNIWVLTDPALPGLYQIYTERYEQNPLVVDLMGHIMHQDTNGKWVPDARYGESVRRKYYRDNKKAREADPNLTDEDKKRMDELDLEEFPVGTGAPSAAAERARKIAEFTAKRQTVDEALFEESPEVTLETLRKIAKKIATDQGPEFRSKIDGITDPRQLKNGIKGVLDLDMPTLDERRNKLAASILGISL